MSFTLMRGDLGWAILPPARRWHFYVEGGKSACKKSDATKQVEAEKADRIALHGEQSAFTPPTGTETPQPEDCTACWERLNHRPVEPDS